MIHVTVYVRVGPTYMHIQINNLKGDVTYTHTITRAQTKI
jgi:hypothetical protein